MFGLFKKKSPMEQLQVKYEALMKDAHALSSSDRKASDAKHAAADAIAREMDALRDKE